MNRVGRAAVMIALGLVMSRLLWTGSFGWFIQQRMAIPLALATAALLAMGAYEGWYGTKEEQEDEAAITRSRAPKVGWMMVLPLVVLVSVAPTGLGAAAADRVDAFKPAENTSRFEPIDTSNGVPELRVLDFVDRAIWDDSGELSGTTVRLEGLVVNDETVADGFLLTRFLVSCCAADGVPIQVAVRGVDQQYADDTWVIVDVVLREPDIPYRDIEDDLWNVEADLVSLEVDPTPPTDSYESPYE